MINVGRIDLTASEPPPATVDEIDLGTGEIAVWWEQSRSDGYFPAFYKPRISPDEQFVAFNYRRDPGTVYVVDRTGHEYIQHPNSVVMQWRPNGDLIVVEIPPVGESRVVYLSLDGTVQPIWTVPPDTEITGSPWVPDIGGAWSPDGRYFVFTTENRARQTAQVYLWQPGSSEPQLLHSAPGDRSISGLTWLPSSQALYFTVTWSPDHGQELWRYDVGLED